MRILHFSDPHGNGTVMTGLNHFLQQHPSDVLACTGDCAGGAFPQMPAEWNSWPHATKLVVPGNHDGAEVFDQLKTWRTDTPWQVGVGPLTFIGVDTSDGFEDLAAQFEQLFAPNLTLGDAVVVLSHRWPDDHHGDQVGSLLAAFVNGRPCLFCHGHDHPHAMHWNAEASLGAFHCYRSHVCSCLSGNLGTVHAIEWSDFAFTCQMERAV